MAPAYKVQVSTFQMGATPVTVGIWFEYLTDRVSHYEYSSGRKVRLGWVEEGMYHRAGDGWRNRLDHPIIWVSYDDIVGRQNPEGIFGISFRQWAEEKTNIPLELPTEAQYEYCARDGGKSIRYPWGDKLDMGRFWNMAGYAKGWNATAPVDRDRRIHVNSYGVSDLVGNGRCWCQDVYSRYPVGFMKDPGMSTPFEDRGARVLRGGGWDPIYKDTPDGETGYECSVRMGWPPGSQNANGFRLVRNR